MVQSLFGSLRTMQSGLAANQSALDILANNISNVNTPGYSRKIVNLEPKVVEGEGAGVDFKAITRRVDEGLLKSVRLEVSTAAGLAVEKELLGRLQTTFGSLDSDTALSHQLAEFQAALETLALSPSSALGQNEVVRQGEAVAAGLRSASTDVQALRQEADQRIGAAVAEVNALVENVSEINAQIFRNAHVGQDVSGLQDSRDQALDRLAELIDARVFYRADGQAVVFTTSGRTLVGDQAATLSHAAATSLSATASYAPGGGDGVDGIYLGAELAENDITLEIRGGEIAALIALRDEQLPAVQAGLDELAVRLRDTVNAVHNRGIPFPGQDGATSTRSFDDPAAQTIAFTAGDTRLVVFDADGNALAAASLQDDILGGASGTLADLQGNLDAWLAGQGFGAAAFDAGGHLAITMADGRSIAFRDEAATTAGSAALDAVIAFDGDGDGSAEQTASGFSALFGFNDFFVDGAGDDPRGVAATLAVRDDLIVTPALVSRGAVQWDAGRGLAGGYFASAGDDSAIQALAAAFAEGADFTAAGGLPGGGSGFADYAALVIGKTAADTETARNRSEYQSAFAADLRQKADTVRGVNLDQELSDLMLYEQAYTATARVMTVVQSMFDALERAVP